MHITGTITFQDFEGGFWGIISDDQARFDPVEGIPHSLQIDGLRVEADVEPANVMSFRMWGQSVHLQSIHRL